MTIYVFIGPSLSVNHARELLDAVYLPPVKMGDIYRVTQKNPTAIAIIDGFFESTPAVWHKEILYALSLGIPVYGASSMGALRAAELHAFGMIGVGKIFEDYASGAIEDDDEVAVVHAPCEDGYIVLSEAMANIRAGLAQARNSHYISDATYDVLLVTAKNQFYADRSWHALAELGKQSGVPDDELAALQDFLELEQPNQKRADAVALLSGLADGSLPKVLTNVKPWVFEQTVYWDTVKTYYGAQKSENADEASFERLRNHVLMVGPARDQIKQRALYFGLLEAEAQRLRIDVTDMRSALSRFRYKRGLQNTEAFRSWMNDHHLDEKNCLDLARLEMLEILVGRRYADKVDQYLERVLKLNGDYPAAIAGVERKWDVISRLGVEYLTEADVGSFDVVLDWYQENYGRIGVQIEEYAADLGFNSKRQFLNELFAEYLSAQNLLQEAN